MKKVAVIMGSDSDLPVVEKAFSVFREYGVPFEVHVYSAHRTPEEAKAFSSKAAENGFGAIIAAAGKAALLAVEILAVSDEALREKLAAARKASAEKVLAKNAEIEAKYHL